MPVVRLWEAVRVRFCALDWISSPASRRRVNDLEVGLGWFRMLTVDR